MRIHWNRIAQRALAALAAGVIAVSALTGTGIGVHAASNQGTLTITPKVGETEISAKDYDGTFKVYKVADYDAGIFSATDAFHFDNYETLLTSENLSNERQFNEITQTVTAWLGAHAEIEAVLADVKPGVSNTLEYGLYMICQDASATGYTDTASSLVMIPAYTDGKTETAVTAYPKVSKVKTPDTPDKPHKPHDNTPPTTPARTGKVALGKSDASTGEALEGVTFILYKADGTAIGTYVTNSEGLIYVDNLPYGKYYFVETQALDGYVLDQTQQAFEISGTDTELLTMTNTPIVPPIPEGTHDNVGGPTGDNSNMTLYGVVAGVAVIGLIAWFVWKRRSENENK